MQRAILGSLILTLAVTLTALACYLVLGYDRPKSLATIHHNHPVAARPLVLAAACTLLACIPPLHAKRVISNGAAHQMAIIAWRFGIMLPALAVTWRLDADQRNYFLITLLACYFVALPLESWLLIRDLQRTADS